ncbi:PREDICTED: uncharacterized protein LOC109151157 [Ipomoea nil]|uniref:uncharacterized protein LOC109151157 n=1 Tax=Ipomoea nil TaxID=35883 RepID=UPI0009012E0F|nr:PREDICTED: uncharacterized protein LOC109151157 [Ipomoea nil]
MAASLAISGTPIPILQLSVFLQAQEFIYADDFSVLGDAAGGGSPVAMFTGRGQTRRPNGDGGSGRRGGQNRGRQGRGGRGAQGRGHGGGIPRCQICRSHGHTAVYCFKHYTTQPPAQANVAVAGDEGAAATVDAWYPDTGTTSHATPDAPMIGQSEDYTGGNVLRVGNGTCLGISRVDHASISSVPKNIRLSNILHAPQLSVPLLSVHRFTNDNDVFFEFHDNYFVVKDSIIKAVLL